MGNGLADSRIFFSYGQLVSRLMTSYIRIHPANWRLIPIIGKMNDHPTLTAMQTGISQDVNMDKKAKISKESKPLAVIKHLLKIRVASGGANATLQQALDYLISKLEVADAGTVWRYEPSNNRLIMAASSGADIKTSQQVRLNPNTGIIGSVFQRGQREVFIIDKAMVDDADTIKKVLGIQIAGLASPAAAVCVPLNADSIRYGALLLLSLGDEAAFTQKDILFFQIVADLLAIFIKLDAMDKTIKEMEVIGNNEKYKAGIVSTLAHEMRTPLTSIKGFSTALLMKEVTYSSEKQREFLEIIDRECDILEDLITDHLESSVIDAGMLKIDLQPVRLRRLAEIAADDVGRRFPKHSLLIDFVDNFPLVDADPERILQVFRQLLDNAAKYSPDGGLIVLQGLISDEKVFISVSDEGVGIAPEDLNHLFDRFFRARANAGESITGTGLGLPISRAIIEAHGGRIWAESQLGQGSKFCINLPLKGLSQDMAD